MTPEQVHMPVKLQGCDILCPSTLEPVHEKLLGAKKKPEAEPQVKALSPWDGQTRSQCHMSIEHHY